MTLYKKVSVPAVLDENTKRSGKPKNCPAGENAVQIDISQFLAGHYQISLESPFGTEAVRLAK